jgi:hypothetical protein
MNSKCTSVKFRKVNFKNDRWSIKIKDITTIFKDENQEYLALHGAKWIDKNKYGLIIINSDVSSELDKLSEHISNAAFICDIINLTGHPVLFIPKWSKLKPLQNILHPVTHFTDTIIDIEQILPLIKMCNSKIHLLGINKEPEKEFVKEYNSVPVSINNFYLRHRIKVKSKSISHKDEFDTIFAYASIIKADLIFNPLTWNKSNHAGQINSIWRKMIDRSEIPLYNYFS